MGDREVFIDLFKNALMALIGTWDTADAEMEQAVRDALDERTRARAHNQQVHPQGSGTPLREALMRAHGTVARLEGKYDKPIQEAAAGMLAIEHAKRQVLYIENALQQVHEGKREKSKTGIYEEARRVIDRMFDFGVMRWHFAQLSDDEIRIIADLIRWKADDATHAKTNSPWPVIFEAYRSRQTSVDPSDKVSLSEPFADPTAQSLAPVSAALNQSATPSVAEFKKMMATWGYIAAEGAEYSRVQGPGRVTGDDPFGGVISAAAATPEVIPMWDRANRQGSSTGALGADDWYRIEVPRGPYALVHMPAYREIWEQSREVSFPPYERLSSFGVELELPYAEVQALKEAELGVGSMEHAIATVNKIARKRLDTRAEAPVENLTRSWMFLLIGRHFMDRIDTLFPHGYFHGAWLPDPAAQEAGHGHLCIVRLAKDGDLANCLCSPGFGPWFERRVADD